MSIYCKQKSVFVNHKNVLGVGGGGEGGGGGGDGGSLF